MPQKNNINKKKSVRNLDDWTKQIKRELSEPLVSGFAAICGILGLITFFISANIGMEIVTIIIFIIMMLIISSTIRFWIKERLLMIYRWFTLKLIIIFFVGIFIGAALYPLFLLPTISSVLTFTSPKVELLDSEPEDGGTSYSTHSVFWIDFKKQIPWPYYNFIRVNITPDTPINVYWSSEHQTINLMPTKVFPAKENGGISNPRFEFDTTYNVLIEGPFLTKPIKLKFSTPSE